LERGIEVVAVLDEKKVGGGKIFYETVLVLKPSFSDEDLLKEIDKVKTSLERWGGQIISFENMGKKKLAYEVRKEKKGIYLMIRFSGAQNTVLEFQRLCRINETIMKFMTIKITEKDLAPPAVVAVPETPPSQG
jgi:small subunit ribosomal protein S6